MYIQGRHIRLIALNYAKNGIRGGTGLIFTFLALTVGLVIASVFISPLEELIKQTDRKVQRIEDQGGRIDQKPDREEIVRRVTEEIGFPIAKWATDDSKHANYLARQKPAVVSAFLMILMFSTPFIICLGAFNQFSGDINNKGLRYLLIRTERANIFFGRFLGTVLFTSVVMGLMLLIVFLYLSLKAKFYPAGDVALWMLQGYGALILFALPYIALCAIISAVIDVPFGSLAICELIVIFIPVFFNILGSLAPGAGYLGYVLPWPLKFQLLHPDMLNVLLASLGMVAYTVVFLGLGLLAFRNRDL